VAERGGRAWSHLKGFSARAAVGPKPEDVGKVSEKRSELSEDKSGPMMARDFPGVTSGPARRVFVAAAAVQHNASMLSRGR